MDGVPESNQPAAQDFPSPEVVPPARAAEAPPSAAPVVALFGATERRGWWRPGRLQTVVALFGGVALDLHEAELPADDFAMRAYAFFGGIKVSLPDNLRVDLTGFSLFGGRSVKPGGATHTAATPVLRLRAIALFGGIAAEAKPLPQP